MTRFEPSPLLVGLLAEIRDARFAHGVFCVRCGSARVRRWGSFSARQRYRCNQCRRTFSDLTGTPAAYLKRLPLLPDYRVCMEQCLSVRASARATGVHATTSFRWRHRLLAGISAAAATPLSGLVEMEEGWILCASTAYESTFRRRQRRSLADPSQRRDWLVVLRDREGRSFIDAVGWLRPNRTTWTEVLSVCVSTPAIMITRHGPLCAQSTAARTCDLPVWHRSPDPPLRASTPLHHVRNARALLHRLRRWLRPFRGIASRYLHHYLIWYELVDPDRRSAWRMRQLLYWPCAPPPSP